jgi:imidazolonepropionase-like amidohydrolase
VLVRAGKLVDVASDGPKPNRASSSPAIASRASVPLPRSPPAPATPSGRSPPVHRAAGFIDAHTHVFLDGTDYANQLLKQSIPFRTIEAVTAARAALDYGFTTIRDLETEGAMYADVDCEDGHRPRHHPRTTNARRDRALAPTGMYPLSGYSWEIEVPAAHSSSMARQPAARRARADQVRRGLDQGVRGSRQLHRRRWTLHTWPNWTDEEFKAIVDETRRLGRSVSAHATGVEGIDAALRAGRAVHRALAMA